MVKKQVIGSEIADFLRLFLQRPGRCLKSRLFHGIWFLRAPGSAEDNAFRKTLINPSVYRASKLDAITVSIICKR